MVSCKVAPHIRRLGASLLHHARGFCHTVDAGESSSLLLLRLLEKSVEASGKHLVFMLRQRLQEEQEEKRLLLLQPMEERLQTEKEKEKRLQTELELRAIDKIELLRVRGKEAGKVLLQRLEEGRQAQSLENLVEEKERLLEEMEKRLQTELELRAIDKIELLRARGLNDVRGVFKLLEEHLGAFKQLEEYPTQIKGTDLWEAILRSNVGLAACIERCTNVRAANTSKQAMHCYNVYSVLLQHVHAGKQLADLQAQRGAIKFQRGPLSPEQVEVLVCLGSAAGVKLVEDKIF